MTKKTTYLLLLFFWNIYSQQKTTKEFSIHSDNDLYSSKSKDGYYTNGIFLSYRYLNPSKNEEILKKIYEIQIGQQLFSPFNSSVTHISQHDRPFAGYLFIGFGISNFHNNNTILEISSQIGVIGPSALGNQTMSFVHKIYNFRSPIGWEHQISNAFALNLHAKYIKSISNLSSSVINTEWINSLNTGTIFNNISSSLNLRIGLTPLKNIYNSLAYEGNLSDKKTNKKELFFHIKPKISYILYDATIQGSFFNDKSPVTFNVKPFVFTTELGISYAIKKINFRYKLTFHSKKLKSEPVPNINKYGSILINYLF